MDKQKNKFKSGGCLEAACEAPALHAKDAIPPHAPVLVIIHGTTTLSGVAEEAVPPPVVDDSVAATNLSEDNDQKAWWQSGSQFDVWLAQRLAAPQGEGLTTSESVVRFEWSGLNSESARESAAKELLADLCKLDDAGRKIHLLAHSHGGNVVRRALELGSVGKNPVTERVRSVTSFGVPFFHYSIMSRVKTAVIWLIIAAAFAGFTFLAIRAARGAPSEGNVSLAYILLTMMLCGATLFFVVKAIIATVRISFQRHRLGSLIGEKVKWKNFCASKDEAISLLMSLNEPLCFLRRLVNPTHAWMNGPLGCGFGLTLILMFPAVGLGLWRDLTGPNFTLAEATDGLWAITVTLLLAFVCVLAAAVCVILFAGLYQILLTLPVVGFSVALDLAITSRLRAFAFGDDAGNGISRVERFPWPGTEQCHVAIDTALEASMEEYVADRTRYTLRDIRAQLQPTHPLFSQDWKTIVKKALTGNELAHTVYYHMESFADLVATTLSETGDWIVRPKSIDGVLLPASAENPASVSAS